MKILYWITTGLLSAMMLFSAFGYFTSPEMAAAFTHLGFPNYFRIELGVLKIIGAAVLLVPAVPARLKELAYFGFALVFLSAAIAHAAVGDGAGEIIAPLVALGVLAASWYSYQRLQYATAAKPRVA